MRLQKIQVEVPTEQYWRRQIKCQYACPVHTDARGYIRAIARGDVEEAYLIARGPNPLASICGRVCGAPCEAACRRGALDESVSIRGLKRFVTGLFGPESRAQAAAKPIELLDRVLRQSEDRECSSTEELRSLRTTLHNLAQNANEGPKVAIIGSGPAGLSAAHDLALLGFGPTVFEMEPIPAGMLAVGIPEYRLPRDLINAEVDVIRSLGVEFRCNTQVGKDITLEQIRREFQATILAVGAKRSRLLPLPGNEGPGVIGAVEFLRDVALDKRSDASTLAQLGQRVVVIGGGNVAYDASRSVIRQVGYDASRSVLREAGVRNVQLVCLESIDEMPADDVEILEGHEEGVVLNPSLGPVEVHRGTDGAVSGVTFKRCLRVFDDNGRFSPTFDETDTTRIEADTVIWAIGQQVDLSFLDPDGDVTLNKRGLIECDQETLRTSAPDVFLAGDLVYGPRLLIDAVASGKKCARSVHAYLTGKPLEAAFEYAHLDLSPYAREPDYEKLPRIALPTVDAEERKRSQVTMVERGYDESQATAESGRCFDCGVNTIFDSKTCILCGGCADVCPERCLRLVSCDRLSADKGLEVLLRERYGEADLATRSAIVKDEEKCIRCALCAERCPVGAITMERFRFSARWAPANEP